MWVLIPEMFSRVCPKVVGADRTHLKKSQSIIRGTKLISITRGNKLNQDQDETNLSYNSQLMLLNALCSLCNGLIRHKISFSLFFNKLNTEVRLIEIQWYFYKQMEMQLQQEEGEKGPFLQHFSCQSNAPPADDHKGREPPPQCNRMGKGSTPTTHHLLNYKRYESSPLKKDSSIFFNCIMNDICTHFQSICMLCQKEKGNSQKA